jgi:hypothetical protein
MIPLVWFLHCGAPATTEGDWDVEFFNSAEGAGNPTAEEPAFKDQISEAVWEDEGSDLVAIIPEGWLAWPGAPGAAVRLHMEDPTSGLLLRVFFGDRELEWPYAEDCSWRTEASGFSSGLRISGELSYSECWPVIPGDGRRLAWRFLKQNVFWLVEARVPGGKAAKAGESLDTLLPGLTF